MVKNQGQTPVPLTPEQNYNMLARGLYYTKDIPLHVYYTALCDIIQGFEGGLNRYPEIAEGINAVEEKAAELKNPKPVFTSLRSLVWYPLSSIVYRMKIGEPEPLKESKDLLDIYFVKLKNSLDLAVTTINEYNSEPPVIKGNAIPALEAMTNLQCRGLSAEQIYDWGWYASPKLPNSNNQTPRPLKEQIDAFKLIEPFLDVLWLKETLRTMDAYNGCMHQCPTCYVDSQIPTKHFTLDSLTRLFDDSRFLEMLQPDSLRIGGSGDISDHEDPVSLVQMVLDATASKARAYRFITGKDHQLKVYTNYRKHTEHKISGLIELARRNTDRLQLVISVPLGKTEDMGISFQQYANRENLYTEKLPEDVPINTRSMHESSSNIGINDVRYPSWLFMTGRVLNPKYLKDRISPSNRRNATGAEEFSQRGFVKTTFNPDALWLQMYVTGYESHTSRAFTPITTRNFPFLKQLPFHPDFSPPSYWPGGVGKPRDTANEAELMSIIAKQSKRKPKGLVVVR